METPNERVHKIRKSLDFTLERFGKPLGVSKTAISNIENGNRNLTEQMKRSICREYHVNPAYLEQGIGDMFIEMTTDTVILEWTAKVMKDQPESFRKRLVAVMATWTEEDWAWIEKQANAIVNGVEK